MRTNDENLLGIAIANILKYISEHVSMKQILVYIQ